MFDILRRKKVKTLKLLSNDRILNLETFSRKNRAVNGHQQLVPDPFLILVNISNQTLHARKSFKNKIFFKRIIKKSLKS